MAAGGKLDTRETTVLFAAAIGGADLYAKAGDVAAADALARCMDVLGEASSKAGARVVKRTPDKLMALAADADTAVEAAAAMHQAMMRYPPLAGVRLALGVAFHHGPVIQKDSDVFGDTVNLAARLVELAGRGQIITTRETARDLGGLYRPWIRDLYATDIKGRSEKVELVELVWQADPDETATTLTVPTKKLLAPAAGALTLVYRGEKTVRRRQRDSITLGRDEKCGLVVHSEDASRLHCTIERKHDKFVLVDHSTNGTYVTIEGNPEVAVQREEFALTRRGTITLGRPKSVSKEIVEFVVE
jgi:class 3 adenylate cyclase